MCIYAVIDLEMCKVPEYMRKINKLKCETIQFGAVLLDDHYKIVDHFNTYVSPKYGYIDPFIRDLTGIVRKDVSRAPSFEEALSSFISWLPNENFKIVAWSKNDEKQIMSEMNRKCPEISGSDKILGNWIDCQPLFAEKMGNHREYQLQEALIAADIPTEGRAHDGYYDAYNTALLFAKISQNEVFTLNPYYQSAHEDKEPERLFFSMGSLFDALAI